MNITNQILEISDFEPFFMYLFGIRIPENLKPVIETPPPSESIGELTISQLSSVEQFLEYIENEKKNRELMDKWIKNNGLRTSPESLNRDIQFLKVSSEFDAFKNMTKKELMACKNDLREFVNVRWLSNDFYQIGINSTSTKDYFNYVSKTKKRDVAIRFKVWFQYEKDNEKRLEKIAFFFEEFQKFEKQIKNFVDSMVFQFDEFGTKKMELKLKNSLLVERAENSQHSSVSFNFNELYKEIEIKTAQNNEG